MKRSKKFINLGLGLALGALISVGLYQTVKPMDYKNVSENKFLNLSLNSEDEKSAKATTYITKEYVTSYFKNRTIEQLESESTTSGKIKRSDNIAKYTDANSVKIMYAVEPKLITMKKLKRGSKGAYNREIIIKGWGAIGGFASHKKNNQTKFIIYKNNLSKEEAKEKNQLYMYVDTPERYVPPNQDADYPNNNLDIYIIPKSVNYSVCASKLTTRKITGNNIISRDVATNNNSLDKFSTLNLDPLTCNRIYVYTPFKSSVKASTLFGPVKDNGTIPEKGLFKVYMYQQTRANNNTKTEKYQKAGYTKLISNLALATTINYNNTDFLNGFLYIKSGVRGTYNSDFESDSDSTDAVVGVNSGMVVRRYRPQEGLSTKDKFDCAGYENQCSGTGEARWYNKPGQKNKDFYYKPNYKEGTDIINLTIPGGSVKKSIDTVYAKTTPLNSRYHFISYYNVVSSYNGMVGIGGSYKKLREESYTLASYIYFKGDMLSIQFFPYKLKYKVVYSTRVFIYINGDTSYVEYKVSPYGEKKEKNFTKTSNGKKVNVKEITIKSEKVPETLKVSNKILNKNILTKSTSYNAYLRKSTVKVDGKSVKKLVKQKKKKIKSSKVNKATGVYEYEFKFYYDVEDLCIEGEDPKCTPKEDMLEGTIQYYLYKPEIDTENQKKSQTNVLLVNGLKYTDKNKKTVYGYTEEPICNEKGVTGDFIEHMRFDKSSNGDGYGKNKYYYTFKGKTNEVEMTKYSESNSNGFRLYTANIETTEQEGKTNDSKMSMSYIQDSILKYTMKFNYYPATEIVSKVCGGHWEYGYNSSYWVTDYIDYEYPNYNSPKEFDAEKTYPLRFEFKTKDKKIYNLKDEGTEVRENVGKIKEVIGTDVSEIEISPLKEFYNFPERNPKSFLTQQNFPVLDERIELSSELNPDNTKWANKKFMSPEIVEKVSPKDMYFYKDKEKSMRYEVPDLDKNLKYKDVTSVDSSGKGTYVPNEDFENDGTFGGENSPRLSEHEYKIPLTIGKTTPETTVLTRKHETRNMVQRYFDVSINLDYIMIPNKYTGFVGYAKDGDKIGTDKSKLESEVKTQYEEYQKFLYKEYYLNPNNKKGVQNLKEMNQNLYNKSLATAVANGKTQASMVAPKDTTGMYTNLIGYKDEVIVDESPKSLEDRDRDKRFVGYNTAYFMPIDADTTMEAVQSADTEQDATYTNYGAIGQLGVSDMYFVFSQNYTFDRYLLGSTLDDVWTAEQNEVPIKMLAKDYQNTLAIPLKEGSELKLDISNNDYRLPKLFGFRSSDGYKYYEKVKEKLGLKDD